MAGPGQFNTPDPEDLMLERLVIHLLVLIFSVVAHELCHLRYLNHGKGFYVLLDRACPWRAEADEWLRQHQDDLLL